MAKQRTRKRVAKTNTTRKRSRVVVPKRKRVIKRRPPKRRRRPPPASVEYSVNVSYRKRSPHASNAISFQMSAIGPPDASRSQVLDVITDAIMSKGRNVKAGWQVKIVSWRDGPIPQRIPWGSLGIIASEPATRFRVE